MELPTPQWKQYGEGGDIIGAKRMRWSFRFLVLGVLLLTFSLWYVENFKRYNLFETQYISALTLHPASARPILRNIVANEAKSKGEVTPKYLMALAAVEEDDIILPTYQQAFKLAPSDTNLLINYGVQLFLADQFLEARDRFREAGIQAPDNALPRYLEAAALAASSIAEGKDPLESGTLVDALALIERANNRNTPIIFPKPLWHPTLPENNSWYNKKRSLIVTYCCAPLNKLESIVIPRAITELEAGRVQHWDEWLKTLENMGQRLMGSSDSHEENIGVVSTLAGLHIQNAAINLRRQIRKINGTEDELLRAKALSIDEAIKKIQTFESMREKVVYSHGHTLAIPLQLVFMAMFMVTLAYVFSWLVGLIVFSIYKNRYIVETNPAWTVPHSKFVLGILFVFSIVLAATLFILDNIARDIALSASISDLDTLLASGATFGLGLALTGAAIFIGIIYSQLKLPGPKKVLLPLIKSSILESGDSDDLNQKELLKLLRTKRRLASVLLWRRYAGIHWGMYLLAICGWFLIYRLVYSAYPTDIALLTVGLREQELELIREIQKMFL
jgi:hypothetical protein